MSIIYEALKKVENKSGIAAEGFPLEYRRIKRTRRGYLGYVVVGVIIAAGIAFYYFRQYGVRSELKEVAKPASEIPAAFKQY